MCTSGTDRHASTRGCSAGARLALALLVCTALAGSDCQWNVGSLDVRLVYTNREGAKPLDRELVERVRIRIEGQGLSPQLNEFEIGDEGGISDLPVGERVRVIVEGLGGVGRPVSRGVSTEFETRSGDMHLFLFISLLGSTSDPPSVTTTKYPDWPQAYRIEMRSGRVFHTAAVLPDQSVLIFGGTEAPDAVDYLARLSSGDALQTAERFDPSAGAFQLDDPEPGCGERLCLLAGRARSTVHVLDDSTVLIVGGEPIPGDESLATETYSTERQRFTKAVAMNTARSRHAAVALPDGSGLLVVGGMDRAGILLDSIEFYDAQTASFSEVGSLTGPRAGARAVACGDGVLVIGGWERFGTDEQGLDRQPSRRVERITFESGTAEVASRTDLHTARAEHTAVLVDLEDEQAALVCGGIVSVDPDGWVWPTSTCELVYCNENHTALTEEAMYSERWAHTATVLPDGKVLVAGGFNRGISSGALGSAEILNPRTAQPEKSPTLQRPRGGHTATLMPNGMVLLVGGLGGDQPDYEIYNPVYNP
ncbi:MAG: hypothetical protein JXR96_29340 [Deltaproteobacteria bacterium]|nr:hypothetical protein [Deltaproteobacteria bacterium]